MSPSDDPTSVAVRVARKGGEASDQQWRDIIGLFRISGEAMDSAYLRRWAGHHGVADLLERASDQGKI